MDIFCFLRQILNTFFIIVFLQIFFFKYIYIYMCVCVCVCVAERTSNFCLARKSTWLLVSSDIFIQWGWLILFCPDLSRAIQRRWKSANLSLPKILRTGGTYFGPLLYQQQLTTMRRPIGWKYQTSSTVKLIYAPNKNSKFFLLHIHILLRTKKNGLTTVYKRFLADFSSWKSFIIFPLIQILRLEL